MPELPPDRSMASSGIPMPHG